MLDSVRSYIDSDLSAIWHLLCKQAVTSFLNVCVYASQIYKGDPRPRIPSRVMALSAMGFKLGVFGFLPTTHAKTSTKQLRL